MLLDVEHYLNHAVISRSHVIQSKEVPSSGLGLPRRWTTDFSLVKAAASVQSAKHTERKEFYLLLWRVTGCGPWLTFTLQMRNVTWGNPVPHFYPQEHPRIIASTHMDTWNTVNLSYIVDMSTGPRWLLTSDGDSLVGDLWVNLTACRDLDSPWSLTLGLAIWVI